MASYLEKLLSNSGSSLNLNKPNLHEGLSEQAGALADDLLNMLSERNGFYALEGALHVFPSDTIEQEVGLNEWNSESLWRDDYGAMIEGCVFFAEDIFGGQFCIKDDKVCTFDPESGSFDYLGENIEDWAQAIIEDYDVLTGYSLAHEWQEQNGILLACQRLMPKVPFVAGGEFVLDNLYRCDSIEGMQLRASIANQIKDLPDGAQIQLTVVD